MKFKKFNELYDCAHVWAGVWVRQKHSSLLKHYNLFSSLTMVFVSFSTVYHAACVCVVVRSENALYRFILLFFSSFVSFLFHTNSRSSSSCTRQSLEFRQLPSLPLSLCVTRFSFFSLFILMKIYFCWTVLCAIFSRWLCGKCWTFPLLISVAIVFFVLSVFFSCCTQPTPLLGSKLTASNSRWQFCSLA